MSTLDPDLPTLRSFVVIMSTDQEARPAGDDHLGRLSLGNRRARSNSLTMAAENRF
jgi:hypothetical protein